MNTYTSPDQTKMNNLRNTNICERHMVSWAYQLSSGMEYLASKKVIHGDLACRNILMQDAQTIKITDFGLSRKLYDYATYVKADQVEFMKRFDLEHQMAQVLIPEISIPRRNPCPGAGSQLKPCVTSSSQHRPTSGHTELPYGKFLVWVKNLIQVSNGHWI